MAIMRMAGAEAPSVDEAAGFNSVLLIERIGNRFRGKTSIPDAHADLYDHSTWANIGKHPSQPKGCG